jgi:xanthine dehydrogenase YagR molybdenum-binding subunit
MVSAASNGMPHPPAHVSTFRTARSFSNNLSVTSCTDCALPAAPLEPTATAAAPTAPAAWSAPRSHKGTHRHTALPSAAGDLAKTLGIPKEKVRIISPYIGGGFGAKLFLRADALLAALGARALRRPYLVFNNTPTAPPRFQRFRIGATRDGRITAIGHESWSGDLPSGRPEATHVPTVARRMNFK